jgi:hypothetical protein
MFTLTLTQARRRKRHLFIHFNFLNIHFLFVDHFNNNVISQKQIALNTNFRTNRLEFKTILIFTYWITILTDLTANTYKQMLQGIIKGEVSLYHWPPVWLVWTQLYENWKVWFYLQNRLIHTSQTGGQQYSDTSPFSIPWMLAS